jgi:hypothetical protein
VHCHNNLNNPIKLISLTFIVSCLFSSWYKTIGENPAELLRDYGIAIRPASPALMLSLLLTIVTYQIFCLCAL